MTFLRSKTGVELRQKNETKASLLGLIKKYDEKHTERRHDEL